jgi:tryptophanyl-tRNA synthetase
MSIITDSTPLEDPKDPDTCNVFSIYKLLAEETQTEDLRKKYLAGNYGYGHAKQELFELILDKYGKEREAFNRFMDDPEMLEQKLTEGEEKARSVISDVVVRVREKLGYAS